jgi:hypothetical protein
LEEAEAHFEQLQRWGFTFIRLSITWEALEHAGPGIYDEAYLAYLRKILLLAHKKGISVFIDPHQALWCRWTGGDGAPVWTLEKIGIDIDQLDAVGAALTRQQYSTLNQGASFPQMMWTTNYNRYAAATMFTLFFAGNTYSPETSIDGETAQDWLQERYVAAMRHCYRRLKDCRAIVGWGTMHEPHPGFIGYRDLEKLENCDLTLGPMPNPFQAMAAASGYHVGVPVYTMRVKGTQIVGRKVYNEETPGYSLFKEGFSCPWKIAGVWTDAGGKPHLLKKDHFALFQGKPVRFTEDFLKPFMNRFTARLREVNNRTFAFIEGSTNGMHPTWSAEDGPAAVHTFHWDAGSALFTNTFRPWISFQTSSRPIPSIKRIIVGRKKVRAYFSRCLAERAAWTRAYMGDIPCLLGEFGLPLDIQGKKAFRTGDYRLHEEALSMYYDAIDANLLHATIWHYTAHNTHDNRDDRNGEDLSSVHHGEAQALQGWLRPYPIATAGIPLFIRWNRKTGVFIYRFKADPRIAALTEIFAPVECFGTFPSIIIQIPPHTKEPVSIHSEYKPNLGKCFLNNVGYEGDVEVVIKRGVIAKTLPDT